MPITSRSILTEIGEVFSRYRTTAGDIKGFDQMMGQVTNNIGPAGPASKKYAFLTFGPQGGEIVNEYNDEGPKRYYTWQKEVISNLERGNDVYVCAPPGGGKTKPLMGYWVIDHLIGGGKINGLRGSLSNNSIKPDPLFNTQGNTAALQAVWTDVFLRVLTGKDSSGTPIGRVLFVTPIRVLAFEQADKFQSILLDILLFLRHLTVEAMTGGPHNGSFIDKLNHIETAGQEGYRKVLKEVFQKTGEQIFNHFSSKNNTEFENFALNLTKESICVKTGGSGETPFSKDAHSSYITIATYGSAVNFIGQIVDKVKFIVFDEAQKLIRCALKTFKIKNEHCCSAV